MSYLDQARRDRLQSERRLLVEREQRLEEDVVEHMDAIQGIKRRIAATRKSIDEVEQELQS